MKEFHVMLGVIVLGFLLLGIGYNRRDANWGVILIGLGVLCMMSTLLYKVYVTLQH